MVKRARLRRTSKVDGAGRILIPADMRAACGVEPGATVTLTNDASGRIILQSRSVALQEAQEYFRGLAPRSDVWSIELIAERRREARREVKD